MRRVFVWRTRDSNELMAGFITPLTSMSIPFLLQIAMERFAVLNCDPNSEGIVAHTTSCKRLSEFVDPMPINSTESVR